LLANTSNIAELREGRSRQFTTFDPITKSKTTKVLPGETRVLAESRQTGMISRLWMTFPGWFWRHWDVEAKNDPATLKKLIIRIYWDGESYPSVECPVGDFFGIGHCEYRHYTSKYLGMSSGGFYSYFPMPYKEVRIEVENLHEEIPIDVFFNANYTELDELPKGSGRFHCLFQTNRLNGTDALPILDIKGRGHYVGCTLSMQGQELNYLSYLEAPEYVFIDTEDDEKPTIVGTGLEDYFNGGWYFREGEFHGELHGVPLKDTLRSMISMYRFHEGDAILFEKSLRIAFINPWEAKHLKPYWYSSTAYWYQDHAAPLPCPLPAVKQLMDMYRIRDVDHQSMP
jgi:hypothetical protein